MGNLYVKSAGGAKPEELILKTDSNKAPSDWSAAGRYIVYTEQNAKTRGDIWLLPLSGDRKPIPFVQTEFNENSGHLSPDGKWMAYQSNDTGRGEIYVQSAPPSSNKWKISNEGGAVPRWRRDGKELFYFQINAGLVSVDIKGRNAPNQFEVGLPQFLVRALVTAYDVSSDGQRFLVEGRAAAADNSSKLTVVINWSADLRTKK